MPYILLQRSYFYRKCNTIDIGGQTSDVSIWQSRKLLWRSSVQIVGRHILIDYLSSIIDLIKDISIEDKIIDDSYPLLQSIQKTCLQKILEMSLRSWSILNYLLKACLLDFISSMDRTPAKTLKLSQNYLCGILYYVGQVIDNLKNNNQYDPKSSKSVTICLGGKASLIFKAIFQDPRIKME